MKALQTDIPGGWTDASNKIRMTQIVTGEGPQNRRPRIFISHSCKDFAQTPDRCDLDAKARQDRLEYARQVREEIVKMLKEKGLDVLLDRNRLDPGDLWQAKLHRWLGTCDGAVVLLDDESVKSEWVRKEVTILTWRQSLKGVLRIVPVVLGEFNLEEIDRHGFAPLSLLAYQAARILPKEKSSQNAKLLAIEAVKRFENMPDSNLSDPMWLWVQKIKAKLDRISPAILDYSRKKFGIADEDWNEPLQDPTTTLAYQLLTSSLEKAYNAFKDFKNVLVREDLRQLVEMVVPNWVNAAAAEHFLTDFNAPSPRNQVAARQRKLLVLNANNGDTACDYVARAFCCDPAPRVIGFVNVAGEGQEEEILANLKQCLVKTFKVEGKEEQLQARIGRHPCFVWLSVRSPKNAFLKRMADAHPLITFTILVGSTFDLSECDERLI